jgi:hypothetical protein
MHFRTAGGLDCVVTERGLAQAPELRRVPDFNFEVELASAREFVLELNGESRPASRAYIERWAAAGAAAQHEDQDE